MAPTTSHHTNSCASCGAKKCADGKILNRCARCRLELYCSRDCQKKHWPSHKTTCSQIVWTTIKGAEDFVIAHPFGNEELLKHDTLEVKPMANVELNIDRSYHVAPALMGSEIVLVTGWGRIPLPAMLGIPIHVAGHGVDDGMPNRLIDAISWDSKESQKKDWALHKKIPKTMRDLSTFGLRQMIMFPHKRPLHEAVPLSNAYT